MDAETRLAICRMLTKIDEDPEYAEKLGLVSESVLPESITVNEKAKEKGRLLYGKQKEFLECTSDGVDARYNIFLD